MSNPYYIALDIETGGLEQYDSILTAFFLVLDQQLNEVFELDLRIKPDGGKSYVINPSAMEVNKINLIEHDKVAMAASLAGQKLYDFLKIWSNKGQYKLIPIGHGVMGDLYCIWHKLLKRSTFEQFTSYRSLDTMQIARFLQICGSLPEELSTSLDSLVKHFKLEGVANDHTASGDTRATVAVLKELIRLQKNGISQINSSV